MKNEQFLDLIESVRAEDASVSRLFSRDDGRGVRRRGAPDPEYMTKLGEAAEFIADVMEGRRPVYHLREAMTTSDFPLLFGDIIDRQMLGFYNETPQTFRNYCRVGTVSDFRTVKRFTIDGAETVLSKVKEQEEYPETSLDEAKYSYAVEKYGRKMPISWETLINDDLDALSSVPERFGRAARRTEEDFATRLFVDASGPHASFYTTANKNRVHSENAGTPNNPPLSTAALQQAWQVLAKQVDAGSDPIFIEMVDLVVPPALEITAMNILNALQIELTESGGTANQKLIAANWMRNRLRVSVNYYIPKVASTANGQTSWFLFGSVGAGRPALEVGFLRGHETPEIFIKEPNQRRIGGGGVNPTDGDFDNDSVEYKLRHVLGGTRVDPKLTVASNGSGA